MNKKIAPVAAPTVALAVAALLAGFLIASCDRTNSTGESPTVPASPPLAAQPTPAPEASAVPSAPLSTVIYHVVSGSEGGRLEKTTITLSADEKDPAAAALNQMAEAKDSPLPKGTHARSVTFGADGIATVDFNKAFQDNFAGGDQSEALMLNAILKTVGQFPNVKKVQLLVEGQKASVGGMQDTTEPLDVPPITDTRVSQQREN